ncbi:HPP family protein [Pseudomonas fluorescens]|uniref:Putative membrane protein n=1 Tax=Pseudomonas fluorescens (strain Pf0-1) TaxID=205922 RepID=Q3KCA4_PSEPF|nr:HPP family protein [Pseudomonas fluorescens]ABA74601.1 putative membrane protein [Pseudomonas fluorescens Pf0-1]MBY9026383.1 HPP family protein [Pseudomonas fluorescens]MBY9030228.1 HPP family protein [Pseudomonas fluorescens]MBY9038201.1 HPP family protein [Pseudomonas fluorescens]MBY9044305.1 HPP family protein [Pseudomonas fluorescens]
MLARWLPAAINTRPTEWSRAAIGMALGTLFSVWACSQVFGIEVAYHLIGPLGASAVLLFAVSSGALAQPWSIIGGYLCAGVVALLVAHVLGRTLGSACLAAGMALILMCWLRCLHPPAGAVALTMVLADPMTIAMDWKALEPVMLSAACLLLAALAYNNLTHIRYPKRPAEPAPAVAPVDIQAITAEDLKLALADMEAFIDVTPEDLEQLIHASERHARRRSIGEVLAGRR